MLRYRIEADISPYRPERKQFRTSSWSRARRWQELWTSRHPYSQTVLYDEAPHLPMPPEQRKVHQKTYPTDKPILASPV